MTAPGSQSVDRAAALLASVVESPRPRSFTSLVDELGLARSTTSRLLQALERNRLVLRDRDGAFRPGNLFSSFALRHDRLRDLADLAQPSLDRLGELTGETVNLAAPGGTEILQVSQVDGRHVLGATNWLGVDVPPHCSAAGKVFYAYAAMPVPAGPLARRTPATIVDPGALQAELEGVRRRGWARIWEELEPGLVAVAAPVRDSRGSVVAGVSVSGPVMRVGRGEVARLGGHLVAEALTISLQLGYRRASRSSGREGAA